MDTSDVKHTDASGQKSPWQNLWALSPNTESSPVSELSNSLQGLQCQDRLRRNSCCTPRRRLLLTPEMLSPPPSSSESKRDQSEEETPTGNVATKATGSRRRHARTMESPEFSASDMTLQSRKMRRESLDRPDSNKENKRVRVRLSTRFSCTASESEVDGTYTCSYHFDPAEGSFNTGETEVPDPMAFQCLRQVSSRRKPLRLPIPFSAIGDQSLIGDFSKQHLLPVERVDRQELQCVSAQTVASLLRGQFGTAVEDFLIIDCRYPYEYQGGHIKGAVNLHTEAQIHRAVCQSPSLLQLPPCFVHSPTGQPSHLGLEGSGSRGISGGSVSPQTPQKQKDGSSSPRKLVVFHCEFSSERGPHLCRYLRELDRTLNAHAYPQLLYPEIYLLQGGYKCFYSCFPELCEPQGYVPMRHREYRHQLHRFRWKRQAQQRRRRIQKSRLTTNS